MCLAVLPDISVGLWKVAVQLQPADARSVIAIFDEANEVESIAPRPVAMAELSVLADVDEQSCMVGKMLLLRG